MFVLSMDPMVSGIEKEVLYGDKRLNIMTQPFKL